MKFPMFGFVLLSFLLLAVVLAVAVFFAFRSGESGKTKMGGLAGCLVALALLGIAGMGAVGLLIVAAVSLPGEAVKHGPVESFEWEWDDGDAAGAEGSRSGAQMQEGSGEEDGGRALERVVPEEPGQARRKGALKVTVELRGLEDPGEVMRWIRKRTDADTRIRVGESQDDRGRSVTVVELTLPPSHDVVRELRELRRDLERDAPELRLPKGAKVKFRGPEEE